MSGQIPGILGAKTQDSVLYEFLEDGRLRWCRADPGSGAARIVNSTDYLGKLKIQQDRIKTSNQFVGSMKGKTIVIFGSGPQLKNISSEWIQYLSQREDISLWGVNTLPKWCKDVWKLDPDKVFDILVAADLYHPIYDKLWSWDLCKPIVKFIKSSTYTPTWRPIRSTGECTSNSMVVYWVDSVTAAMSIAAVALASASYEKNGIKNMKKAEGNILLLGVEHNKRNHCYSDVDGFYEADNPNEAWGGDDYRNGAHSKLKAHARWKGFKIYNGAPWSLVESYEKVDADEFLKIPRDIACDVSKSCPEVGERLL